MVFSKEIDTGACMYMEVGKQRHSRGCKLLLFGH